MITPTNREFVQRSYRFFSRLVATQLGNQITNKIVKNLIKARIKTPADLASFKREVSKKYKVPCPSNIELLKAYHKLIKNERAVQSEKIENLLKTRPVRSLSGIINISVLTKPYPCPGKCLYCPQEKGIPKSYLSGEPAVERAKKLDYDPYLQVKKRIETLELEGHPTDKIELRIIGGTWSYYPREYQNRFIKRCFQACNKSVGLKISNSHFPLSKHIQNSKFKILEKEQKRNEGAQHRIIGLSIETRPDFIDKKEIKRLRELGVTMVELGVQSIYDGVLKLNLRGHGKKETVLATKLLKNAGFKVLDQIMPNLPGSDLKRDKKMFEELFQNPDFRPDYLKIYPCALLKEAPLYKWWRAGKYRPYTQPQLINLLKSIKKKIPYYVRVQRITRDIPSSKILEGGAKISNLRQILIEKMKKEGWRCKCIRCREVRENYNPKEKLYLFRQDYNASEGREIFLSFEVKNREKLYSLLRLRLPVLNQREKCSRAIFPVLKNAGIIREIQTFGQQLPLVRNVIPSISPQHKGLGKKLIKEAEKITKKEFGLNKIAIISGVGARRYFSELGYKLKSTYMVKVI